MVGILCWDRALIHFYALFSLLKEKRSQFGANICSPSQSPALPLVTLFLDFMEPDTEIEDPHGDENARRQRVNSGS